MSINITVLGTGPFPTAAATQTPTLIYTDVPIGIGPPNFLEVTLTPGNSPVPFSAVTGGLFTVTRPDNTEDIFNATVVSATSQQIVIGYLFDGDEITLPGLYNVAVQLQIGTGGLIPVNPFQLLAAALNDLPPTVTPPTVVPDNQFPIITSISIGLISAPFDLVGIVHMGQSLGAGFFGTPVLNSGGMRPHVKLFDSSGSYTDPNASTLSLIDANGPLRPITSGLAPPNNIEGETPELQGARALRFMALGDGYSSFSCALTNVCYGGQPYSVICKGGTGNPYAFYEFEVAAIQRLYTAANPGKKYGVGAVWLTHGEADDAYPFWTPRTTYAGDLLQLQSDVQFDAQRLTGQASVVPLLYTQQSSYPAVGFGSLVGNATALAMADDHDGINCILVGPKYQLKYYQDNVHLINTSYELLGEKYAQATFQRLTQGRWDPLYCKGVQRTAQGAICTFHVPVSPLVFDPIAPSPHQVGVGTGYYTQWANGQGFEAYDHVYSVVNGISSLTTNNGQIQVNLVGTHSFNTGDVINSQNCLFSDTASVRAFCRQWTITVVSPSSFVLNGSTPLTGTLGVSNTLIFRILTITAPPVISGNTVTLAFDRAPAADLVVQYAMTSDVASTDGNTGFSGGYMQGSGGCGGRLRDSDPYAGPTGIVQPNWCCLFSIAPP